MIKYNLKSNYEAIDFLTIESNIPEKYLYAYLYRIHEIIFNMNDSHNTSCFDYADVLKCYIPDLNIHGYKKYINDAVDINIDAVSNSDEKNRVLWIELLKNCDLKNSDTRAKIDSWYIVQRESGEGFSSDEKKIISVETKKQIQIMYNANQLILLHVPEIEANMIAEKLEGYTCFYNYDKTCTLCLPLTNRYTAYN